MEPTSSAENKSNGIETNDGSTSEENSQRKRSREGSQQGDEEVSMTTINETGENIVENESTENLTTDAPLVEESKNDSGAPTKRPRLHVEQDEATNDTNKTKTSTTDDESKDLTPPTTDDDEDDEDEDDDDDEDDEYDDDYDDDDDDDELKQVDSNLPPPKPSIYSFIRNRELGIFHPNRMRADCRTFHDEMISNRAVVQRMTISHTLDGHEGCVNSLSFNRTGTLLVSGSDDLRVIIWDWASKQVAVSYPSEHQSNVFQTKFVPYSNDCKIVSCARDGQVRLGELRPDGSFLSTTQLVEHNASAHKITIDTITGTDVFSCGEDSAIYHIDLREHKATKILSIRSEPSNMLPLYSVDLNRCNQNEFVVAGMDPQIRIYDRRRIEAITSKPMKSFCPDLIKKIENRRNQPSVTCAVYNHNGSEIVGTYNDEDIYLFDATHSDGADSIHHYRGHRNKSTVKGVNFYGRNSEYIISGSDCGQVFIWEKETEKCVWFGQGDEEGTVNVLEPHPYFPVIATSGLDHNIKIWEPLHPNPVDFLRMESIMKRNNRERKHDQKYANMFDADATGLFRLMRPVFRRIVSRTTQIDLANDNQTDENEQNREDQPIYSFDCAPS